MTLIKQYISIEVHKLTENRATATCGPVLGRLYDTLEMTSDPDGIVTNPCNSSEKYKTFLGQDFYGNHIFAIIAYTIEDCLTECGKYNEFGNSVQCDGGNINGNQKVSVNGEGANCFLKTFETTTELDETKSMAIGSDGA